VWARKGVARSIRGVQATSAATGWGGYLGNKGAVAVRLRVHDAPLVVVCTHLASGDARGDEQRRNADVADIVRRCVFENPDAAGGCCSGVSVVAGCALACPAAGGCCNRSLFVWIKGEV
jgi:phosphatidylinositol-bisphosphatase